MRTPALKRLMAGYFHQDFDDVHGGVWEALDAFISDLPDLAAQLPVEIAWVLGHFETEDGVDAYLDELGCEYLADQEDGGYREWLRMISRRVDTAMTP